MLPRIRPTAVKNAALSLVVRLGDQPFPFRGFAIVRCFVDEWDVIHLWVMFRNKNASPLRQVELKAGPDGFIGENEIYQALLVRNIDEYFLETFQLFAETLLTLAERVDKEEKIRFQDAAVVMAAV